MDLKEFIHYFISLIQYFFCPNRVLRLHISESCELIEMSSESISSMFKCLISGTNKTTSFDHIVPTIKSRSCKVFIYRMDFEILEGVDGSGAVLPYISNNIIELSSLKKVHRIG